MPVDLLIIPLIVEISNSHPWPLDNSTGGGDWSASWSFNISSNCRNLKLPFLATRWLYWWWEGRSASCSANISSNSENLKLHSWPLDDSTGGGRVDLPVDLPILAITVEISNCHSSPLDNSTGGVGYICQLIC